MTPIATTIGSSSPRSSARRTCPMRWLPADALTSTVVESTSSILYTPTLRAPETGSRVRLRCHVPR